MDIADLIDAKRKRDWRESNEAEYPILCRCEDCETEWYSQHPGQYCLKCHGPVVCTPVAACRDCRRTIVNIVPILKCEHCHSTNIVREGEREFPYCSDAEWARRCEGTDVL